MQYRFAVMISLLMGCGIGPECPLCEGFYAIRFSLESGCAESDFFFIANVDDDGPDIVPDEECTGSSGLEDDGCSYDYAYRCASSEVDGGSIERTIALGWVDETSMTGSATITPFDESGTMGCVDHYSVELSSLNP